MVDEDQERYLDEGLKSVKACAYQIQTTIERNNMRECLRQSSQMLQQLKTNNLTPKSYYGLYSVIFDEMQYVYNFFKEEARRGRRMKDLYDTVQQASNLIPRLYLMITTGAVYIENQTTVSSEIIFDLLGMVKGVQNPTRGLFTRYYLLKMVKDKLPDKGNEFEGEKSSLNDTLTFILQNLEEMNRLWIRLSTGTIGQEKIMRDKERNELRILVGENIVRLSSLEGLTLDLYQNEILPKIINILLESKDQLSQQYLMECIIHAFPDEYNIHCMQLILETSTKLNQNVDVKSLFIALMEKLAKFVGDSGKDEAEIMAAAEKVFSLLRQSIDTLTQQGIQLETGNGDPCKLLELQLAFMKFTVKCCPAKDKLSTINHVLTTTSTILTSYNKKLAQDGINLLRNILIVPLESELSLFDFVNFPELMVFLDFNSRATLALRIIDSLSNKEKLDSTEKVNILLGFIRPLLEDSNDTIELDPSEFEYQQNVVAKILFVIKTNDPNELLDILVTIIPVFAKGGNKRIKYTLPTLANAFLNLGNQITLSYDNKLQPSEESHNGIHDEFINFLDMKSFESDDIYEKFMLKIHNHIKEIISMVNGSFPELAFNILLSSALQANSIHINADKFTEIIVNYINSALNIIQENQSAGMNSSNRMKLLNVFMGTLMQIRNTTAESLGSVIGTIQQLGQSMNKRAEQCNSLLSCSSLYYSLLDNKEKAYECLRKAKRYADFSMSNPENLKLYVQIINKFLYYIEITKDDDLIFKIEDLEDIIDLIKNHIITIKNECVNQDFLPEIERYFNITVEIILKRKNEKKHKFFDEINLEIFN